MPVYRDKSGRIIEEKTHITKKENKEQDTLPPDSSSDDPPSAGGKGYDAPTVIAGRGAEKNLGLRPSQQASQNDGGKTRIFGRRQRLEPAQEQAASSSDKAMDDPPVGWLVVIFGPGQGNHLTLGYGQNSIGRGPQERVRVDFGDEEISRSQHAVLTYEPRGRKFYLQQGQGTNLVYLYDQPVLTPVELPPSADISIGGTILRFVPLCGQAFDWQDIDKPKTEEKT